MKPIECIKRRKSIRKYDRTLKLSDGELKRIWNHLTQLKSLDPDIMVDYQIVKSEEVNSSMGEYCLLLYSEEKPHYLLNAGYLLGQMDLYFVSRNIGTCWYGMGKTEQKRWKGLSFVIMIAFGKCTEKDFRSDLSEFKRHRYEKVVEGDSFKSVIETSLLAPSAVNSQPWRIKTSNNEIVVYRTTNTMLKFAKVLVDYFNKIDMGIYLCFLETVLLHEGIQFEHELLSEKQGQKQIAVAVYHRKKEE